MTITYFNKYFNVILQVRIVMSSNDPEIFYLKNSLVITTDDAMLTYGEFLLFFLCKECKEFLAELQEINVYRYFKNTPDISSQKILKTTSFFLIL